MKSQLFSTYFFLDAFFITIVVEQINPPKNYSPKKLWWVIGVLFTPLIPHTQCNNENDNKNNVHK